MLDVVHLYSFVYSLFNLKALFYGESVWNLFDVVCIVDLKVCFVVKLPVLRFLFVCSYVLMLHFGLSVCECLFCFEPIDLMFCLTLKH